MRYKIVLFVAQVREKQNICVKQIYFINTFFLLFQYNALCALTFRTHD